MATNIRRSSSPKALAASFPLPTLADAMDAVRLSADRFCLLAGVEADQANGRGTTWGNALQEDLRKAQADSAIETIMKAA